MDKCPYCKRQLASLICPAHGFVGKEQTPTPKDIGAVTPTQLTSAVGDVAVYGVPSGGIIMWSGAASAIPDGWVVCDGTNGTPNLVGQFIIGTKTDSGATYDVGDTGGVATVTLTAAETGVPSHTHTVHGGGAYKFANNGDWVPVAPYSGGAYYGIKPSASLSDATDAASSAATPHTNLPPYYALCYIMKT